MRYLSATTALLFTLLLCTCGRAQEVPENLLTGYAPLDEKLARTVTVDEYAISAEAAAALSNAKFLDAREHEEFTVSHLPAATWLGYDDVDLSRIADTEKDQPLVVYCTIGYRSERVATKLREAGYTNVYNLYGSLYAWKLAGFALEDARGQPTEKLHTYNRKWSTFAPDSIGEKVWK
ncbi:rhodanese-like domain-containing protein [Neolewinella antarctica]|uniref:Rhodanese-related sulfurtransferase n=1 Tax=Neolewinella antarctica TaxID=442734 RepID=A0ABX0XEK9_9BACT|nr:rhodanese-like domain-containing protein [Neolewinella antarctica]NJC27545.1 rhodanese-related sulfurtransferase [Neolewinella antarctica]